MNPPSKKVELKDLLNKKVQLNISGIEILKSFLFLLIPNFFFLIICYFANLARPLINIDYLIPTILILIPNRYIKIIGGISFCFFIALDAIMLTLQIFPFFKIAEIIYFIPFIFDGPLRYLVISAVVIVYIILFPLGFNKLVQKYKVNYKYAIFSAAVFYYLFLLAGNHWKYFKTGLQHFGHHNHYVINSELGLYQKNYGANWFKLVDAVPEIGKGQEIYASRFLERPFNKKILFIIAESWGEAREERVTQALLKNIYAQQDHFEYIKHGFFDFAGSTVQAELRELCQLRSENGYSFHKMEHFPGEHCLPQELKQAGYQTYGLHGAGGLLYDRNFWYPRVGLDHISFAESFLGKKRCYAFKGICDSELFGHVAEAFKKAGDGKIFFYWMTLTSHTPFAEQDVQQAERLDCKKYDLFEGDVCNSFKLHAQFFDGLAELIRQPEMKGTEVIVVGDHMPPVLLDKPIYKNIHWQDVAWLHFKIKD